MQPAIAPARPEVWAGVECTVNRVGDGYFDQLVRTGHDRRADDVDRLILLGVTAVRYPVLWEKHAADPVDWTWADARLARFRAVGVRPIVGLVHHGSGPPDTSLTDPRFPDRLAEFASKVAERYPWVDAYTPVNEPLTTARFSGLYGHWYPHGRDNATFVRCLLTQCRAVATAMRAVRRVNPKAQLVQTDDLGQTHAPPAIQYQADFENERRWVTWDLLCGRVNRHHPMWGFLRWCGAADADLEWFLDHPCPPDVLGVNYYVTSERYLDDRLDRYPPHLHGGNGRHRYADVEAVRVLPGGPAGAASLLRQAWERFRLPVAITEAHLGCTREEQLRWLADVWREATAALAAGADVRAVTAWSAFGACDWDSLVTRETGRYEPGVFDVRSGSPRPTAIAALVGDLAAGRDPDHPVLDTPGWWRRPERLLHERGARNAECGVEEEDKPGPRGGCSAAGFDSALRAPRSALQPRPLLITGATGTLGRALDRICRLRGLACVLLDRRSMDIADHASVAAALAKYNPWAVVNAAGYVRVDAAERDVERCRRENVDGPTVLAERCAGSGVRFVTFSSDLVFDGRTDRPYHEGDPVCPLNVYGATKAEAERRVLARDPHALVIRASAFYGPWDEHNFVHAAVATLRGRATFAAADDLTVSPSYVPDLCHAALDLLVDGADGVWHLAAPDAVTWAALAREAAGRAGLDPAGVVGRPAASFGWAAPRPVFSALGTVRGAPLPPLADGLDRFFRDLAPRPAA